MAAASPQTAAQTQRRSVRCTAEPRKGGKKREEEKREMSATLTAPASSRTAARAKR